MIPLAFPIDSLPEAVAALEFAPIAGQQSTVAAVLAVAAVQQTAVLWQPVLVGTLPFLNRKRELNQELE